ncbi:phage tail tape measure protein [Prosthecomicrobium pneumaticum]|uniref:Phage-related minor tail protein n=1 Tax=Prosthecomicrobium pneumaticum TaxID=81895 RepID=A0A7W9FR20_9HYPH|nr:phage tail tape measure protein [Prosthecomicrobium pneumaticum]MBB5755290.1 phage-related minor tail protein [Prosthecomicrobium pneumaticum]
MATVVDELAVRITADTAPFRAALDNLTVRTETFSGAIARALRDAVVGGKAFDDVLKGLALRISGIALNAALKPIGTGIAGLFSDLLGGVQPFAKGGVVPFAAGGVVATPSYFPLPRGLGLAGEAGPEAILPLSRGADGRLGVAAAGGGGATTVNVTIATADAASFRKGEAQVAAALARAVARGRRGL